ncbi:DUF7594 domain-containing protein [Pseudocolwellia agarivorans]|uniref:CBM96 family carbohydrate-binding protein n=1 Tax=Pseudocolwellia agarivorans TaxID=1911682 RepID=UPI000986F8AB|nr:DUF4955 domain-containing protein [Pseudocolwellia agarivorans]
MSIFKRNKLPITTSLIAAIISHTIVFSANGTDVNIWKKYTGQITTENIPVLTDYSFAGYQLGSQAIPQKHNLPIFDVTHYGAGANDSVSDQAAIQATIDAAEANGGGIVFFPPGEFLVNATATETGTIRIEKSNIILKGSGSTPGGTVINMKNHMLLPTGSSAWNTPNMFTFSAPYSSQPKTNIIKSENRGNTTIQVKNSSIFIGKKHLLIELPANPEANSYFLDNRTPRSIWSNIVESGVSASAIHEIASIDTEKNTVTLKDPIIDDIQANHHWTAEPYTLIENVGFEDIHFKANFIDKFVHHKDYIHDYAWHAISMGKVANSWVTRSRFTNVTRAVGIYRSYASSIINLLVDGNNGHALTTINGGSSRILQGLLWDNTLDGQFHGADFSGQANGSVSWRIDTPNAKGWDIHAAQPRTNLLDNYTSKGINGAGGHYSNYPGHLIGLTIWNQKVTGTSLNNVDFWPVCESNYCGTTIANPIIVGYHGNNSTFLQSALKYEESHGSPVTPISLYEAQLSHRLGYEPEWVSNAKNEYATLKTAWYSEQTSQTSLSASADSFIRNGASENNNYGLDAGMNVKLGGGNYTREALVKFDLSELPNNISLAKIMLTATSIGAGIESTSFPLSFIEDDSWEESLVTWSNKPIVTTVLDTASVNTETKTIEWNVTSQVIKEMSDDKTLSVNISSDSEVWATFASKENEILNIRPLLIVKYKDKPPVIPAADFSYQANNLVVNFRDASVDADGTVESYNWTFADNTNSTVANPSHTFATAGTYSVSLTVTDNDGAINTKTVDITVSANEASTINIPVIADAYVQSGNFGENNYGATKDLYVKLGGGSYTREALLKFDLSAVKNKVISANLRLNAAAGGTNVKWPVKAIADDNWLESTVTWNNKPASGAVLDTHRVALTTLFNGILQSK